MKLQNYNGFDRQLNYWIKTDKKVANKIKKLIDVIREDPFDGIGKPEPLRHELSGMWSRRIDRKNRLIYLVTEEAIILISCLGHYEE